jgi:hypothetical protein
MAWNLVVLGSAPSEMGMNFLAVDEIGVPF